MLVGKPNKKKHMSKDDITSASDDLSVLRVLMHTIKGISAVEMTPAFSTVDEEPEE